MNVTRRALLGASLLSLRLRLSSAQSGPPLPGSTRDALDLNGVWEFRTDPDGAGEGDRWFDPRAVYAGAIEVPGAWQAQGVGEPDGFIRSDYSGVAWYRRRVAVPESWKGRRIRLRIQGVLRQAKLFVNGAAVEAHAGHSRPWIADLTAVIRPGEENVIAVQVSNAGEAVTAHPERQEPAYPTGLLNYIHNWGGIYGRTFLTATSPTAVSSLHIRPDVRRGTVRCTVAVESSEAAGGDLEVRVAVHTLDGVEAARAESTVSLGSPTGETTLDVTLPDARPWTPDDPHLYRLTASLYRDGQLLDETSERLGMRQFEIDGTRLLLNGRPLYLRGYGDDNIEVLTGTPPADKSIHLERLRRAKSFGFNAVRFHSMTPPPEYFDAADEVGMLVMPELPVVYAQYLLPFRDYLRAELRGVLMAHRNRASFFSPAFGNEFNLNWIKTEERQQEFLETVDEFYQIAKTIAPEALIRSNDGFDVRPTDFISTFTTVAEDLPTIRHEFGEYYCSLPDIALLHRFTGVIRPLWLEEKFEWARSRGLLSEYDRFVSNSKRLQQLGRAFQIERVRSDERVSGYTYWLIVDYPGGTGEGDSWEEGWFDYFWAPKDITPEEGRRLNSAVLPLIDLPVTERALTAGESKSVAVTISNFGEAAIRGGMLRWRLLDGDSVVANGEQNNVAIGLGEVGEAARFDLAPPAGAPRELRLEVELRAGDRHHSNHWTLWSFPTVSTADWPPLAGDSALAAALPDLPLDSNASDAILVVSELDEKALRALEQGRRVWWMRHDAEDEKKRAGFYPRSGGAQGTVIHAHSALGDFPRNGWCELQFLHLMEGARPLPVDSLAPKLEPVIADIRTAEGFLSKKKDLSYGAFLLEARVGAGRLLATAFNFREPIAAGRVEALYLADRLVRYMSSPAFQPETALSQAEIQELARS